MGAQMKLNHRIRTSKTPIISRSLVAVALLIPATAGAEALGEADVIRHAADRSAAMRVASGSAALAEAQAVGVGLYPNPSLSWDHEQFVGDRGETEDALVISVPIDLSSRRSMGSTFARAQATSAQATVARSRSRVVVQALDLFYAAIGAEQRAAIEQRSHERLTEAALVVQRRKQEGKASGHDEARIEIEVALTASALRQSRTDVSRLRTELAQLLGLDPSTATFTGDLKPTSVDGGVRRSLDLLRQATGQLASAEDDSGRAWIPTLSVSAGLRVGDADVTRFGYVAGISVDVPVFERAQGLKAQAEARTRLAAAEADAAARAALIESTRARTLVATTRAELDEFDRATSDRIDRLERAAESGYREGQRSVLELLDVRRTRTTIDTRRLDLELAVKRAEVALRAANGEFE